MRGSGTILRRVVAGADVRRAELAFCGFNLAEYGVWVSVLVYAFQRGGTTAAALVAVAQLLPAAALAPSLARAIDRVGARAALRRGYRCQSATLGVTALALIAGAPDLLVYAGAVLAAPAVTMTRPAQAALVPLLAADADELTAINVLSGWVESVSVLAGPALAGGLLALDGPGAAVATFALCTIAAAWLIGGVTPRPDRDVAAAAVAAAGVDDEPDAWRALTTMRRMGLTAPVTLLGVQFLVIGMLDVVLVILAIRVLGLGAPGAGYLNGAFGAGGILGSLAAIALIGRHRLAMPLVAAGVTWGLLLAVLGAWPTVGGAFVILIAAGALRTVLDVSGRTLLLRALPPAARGRIFGLLEGVAMLNLAVGSLLVAALDALGGAGAALIVTGAALSCTAGLTARRLRRIEDGAPRRSGVPGSARPALGGLPDLLARPLLSPLQGDQREPGGGAVGRADLG
jgi:hypothetical protein